PLSGNQHPAVSTQHLVGFAEIQTPNHLLLFVLTFIPFGQVWWRVIDFTAAGLLNFLHKGCSVVALRRQLVGLALVVPALGVKTLRFFEMRDGLSEMASFVELLAQAELG